MKQKDKRRLSDYDTSGKLSVTEMFGAIFFMVFNGLKKDYNHYYQVKYQKRNIRAGYLLGALLFLFLTTGLVNVFLFVGSSIQTELLTKAF